MGKDSQNKGSENLVVDLAKTEEAVDKLLQMDINDLSMGDRSKYLWFMAVRMGLDPLTKPFDCIPDGKGKVILFANSGCADQLRRRDNVTVRVIEEGFLKVGETIRDDVYVVKVEAETAGGRSAVNVGAVGVKGLTSEAMANAIMKCHTKASRRTTLDLCGLGIPDISELDSIPNVAPKMTATGPRQLNPGVTSPVVEESQAVPIGSSKGADEAPKKYPPAVPPIKLPRS